MSPDQLIRVFTLGPETSDHTVGFEAQTPTGDGCTVTFDDISFHERPTARPPQRNVTFLAVSEGVRARS